MDKEKIESLIEVHKDKPTKELKAIVLERNVEEWDIEALEAMEQILESRDVHLEFDLSEEPTETPSEKYSSPWVVALFCSLILLLYLTLQWVTQDKIEASSIIGEYEARYHDGRRLSLVIKPDGIAAGVFSTYDLMDISTTDSSTKTYYWRINDGRIIISNMTRDLWALDRNKNGNLSSDFFNGGISLQLKKVEAGHFRRIVSEAVSETEKELKQLDEQAKSWGFKYPDDKDEKGEQAINDTVAEFMAQRIKLLEEEKLKKSKEATPKAKPTKEVTKEDVVGTYEVKIGENSVRMVYLENGICEWYANGKKEGEEGKWKIVEGQMHIIDGRGNIDVVRINKDNSITRIATILKDGRQEDIPKEKHLTFKKIK